MPEEKIQREKSIPSEKQLKKGMHFFVAVLSEDMHFIRMYTGYGKRIKIIPLAIPYVYLRFKWFKLDKKGYNI